MEKAKRFNQEKVDLSLLPEVAALEECKVWMSGMQKYGRNNWQKLWGEDTINLALACLLRHAMAISSGELFDKESGLPHAAHVRCNAAMILEHMAREGMINPRVYQSKIEETAEGPAFFGGGNIFFHSSADSEHVVTDEPIGKVSDK